MHRSSLGCRPLSALLGLAFLLAPPGLLGAARAADPPERVKFETIDEVELHGTFYPGKKGKKSPTALLLHKIGGHSHQDGWDKLAEGLQEKGYAVLSFDFRGHGASTGVGREFWSQLFPINRTLRGFSASRPKTTISHKDFPNSYMPYLVNDISTAKSFLDRKNDAGECNASSLVLIGAEDGATLGALWMYTEWYRFRVTATFPALRWDKTAEGRDHHAAVWLSISPTIGGRTMPVGSWMQLVGREKKVPMAFVYGDGDSKGELNAGHYLRILYGSDKASLPLTNKLAVKGTKLTGSGLLKKELATEEWIIDKYLTAVFDKNQISEWLKRDFEQSGYVWFFPTVGDAVPAKEERQKALLPIPIKYLGIGP
jgi:hypothetical protein